MPKVKTHSSAKKRFKVTAKGKIKRFQAKTSHMMRNKTTKQKRNLEGSTMASKVDTKRILRLLGKRK